MINITVQDQYKNICNIFSHLVCPKFDDDQSELEFIYEVSSDISDYIQLASYIKSTNSKSFANLVCNNTNYTYNQMINFISNIEDSLAEFLFTDLNEICKEYPYMEKSFERMASLCKEKGLENVTKKYKELVETTNSTVQDQYKNICNIFSHLVCPKFDDDQSKLEFIYEVSSDISDYIQLASYIKSTDPKFFANLVCNNTNYTYNQIIDFISNIEDSLAEFLFTDLNEICKEYPYMEEYFKCMASLCKEKGLESATKKYEALVEINNATMDDDYHEKKGFENAAKKYAELVELNNAAMYNDYHKELIYNYNMSESIAFEISGCA